LSYFLITAFAAIFPNFSNEFFKGMQNYIATKFGWFYILAVAVILLSIIILGFSKLGEIKLGADHVKPEHKNISWFSMLFAAGMGIGLVFFGVAEPLMHYLNPPVGDPQSVAAQKLAMNITFFHWGMGAWSVYAIVALILAFFSYRHGLPLTLRSAFYPIIGDKIYGKIGSAIDTFAVVATLFGVATSLGYGVLQVNAGLTHVFGLPTGFPKSDCNAHLRLHSHAHSHQAPCGYWQNRTLYQRGHSAQNLCYSGYYATHYPPLYIRI